jgi:uncharacterized small protein (DUF1192 family)
MRFRVADNQAQRTLGGNIMEVHQDGPYVLYSDYARLKAEVERLTSDLQMEKENEDRLVREWQRANNEVYGLQRQVAALIDDQTRLKAECQARQAENSVLAVECDSLKAEVERLKADLNKMTKTPDGVDYVEVDVSFWTKSGSRLPSSYSTFWSNDKGVQS